MADFGILSLDESEEWNAIIQELPIGQRDVYYTPEYYRLYEEMGDGKAQCFVYEQGNDLALYPFLINSVNQLGYVLDKEYFDIQGAYGYNGVVTSSYHPGFIAEFYKSFDEWCRQNNIIAEFTRFHPLLKNQKFSDQHRQVIYDRKTVFIDLRQPYSEIFNNYQRTTRKQIKRATKRHHLRVIEYSNAPNCVDIFYPIYKETMDRSKAEEYLYFNKAYFYQLLDNTSSVCFVAMKGEKPIASIIAFYNEQYLHGHLGGAFTKNLEMSPSAFLYDHIIKFGIEKSCKYFHVGGGRTTATYDALLSFKTNFSNKTSDFFIGKKIHNLQIYNKVVEQWVRSYPERVAKFKHHLLKYRY